MFASRVGDILEFNSCELKTLEFLPKMQKKLKKKEVEYIVCDIVTPRIVLVLHILNQQIVCTSNQ